MRKLLIIFGVILFLGLGIFIFKEKIFFKTYKSSEHSLSFVYSRFWKTYNGESRTRNTLTELVDTNSQNLITVYFRVDAIPKYSGSDSPQEKDKNTAFLKEQVLEEDRNAVLVKEEDLAINGLFVHRSEWLLSRKINGQNLRMITAIYYGTKGFDYSITASTTEKSIDYGSVNYSIDSLKEI